MLWGWFYPCAHWCSELRGDLAFCNLCLPSFLILLSRKFADFSVGFLAPVGMSCNPPHPHPPHVTQAGSVKEIVPERISKVALRVFNQQMACLHPAVLAPGGGPGLCVSWLAPVYPSRAYSNWLVSPFPHAGVLLYLTFIPSHSAWRERETSVARPWLASLGTAVGWRNLHMHDFCNLFARPVFMSMLIVGSAMVQL